MGMKKIYTCDLCKEKIIDPDSSNLFGLRFHEGEERFTLGGYGVTDGSHICIKCAKELKRQLNKPEIEKIMTGHEQPSTIFVGAQSISRGSQLSNSSAS